MQNPQGLSVSELLETRFVQQYLINAWFLNPSERDEYGNFKCSFDVIADIEDRPPKVAFKFVMRKNKMN